MAQDLFAPLYEYMDEEAVGSLRQRIADKYGYNLSNLSEQEAADIELAVSMRLENEKKRFSAQEDALRNSPGVQQALAETQLGAPVDITREASAEGTSTAGLPFSGFFGGAQETASPVVLGQGGSRSLEGEIEDIRALVPPGSDVKPVEQFKFGVNQSESRPYVLLPGSTEYIPWDKPGMTATDVGQAVGSMASLEGLISVMATRFPIGNLLTRSIVSGTGAAAGAALDSLTQESKLPGASEVLNRAGWAFGITGGMDFGLGALTGGANLALNKGRASLADDPIQQAGQEAARITQELGLYPLQVGQDRGFAGKLVSRLSQYSDAFRSKLVSQQLTLGDSFFGNTPDKIQVFDNLDDLDKGLVLAGLDNKSLEELYQGKLRQIEQQQRAMISSVENPASRSAGGRAVQQGIFQISNKDRQSFRLIMNQRIGRLEDQMESLASTGRFEIDLTDLQKWADEQLQAMPVPQTAAGIPKAGELYDSSGNTFEFINKVNDSALRNTLELIRGIPGGKLTNDTVVPTSLVLPGGGRTSGPDLNVSGLEILRMLRGSLSDFYGNELVRGTTQEGIAKQAYQQLTESLKNASGSPAFVGAVRKYNAASSYTYKTLDKLVSMNMASMRDPAGLVNTFVAGGIDYQTWNYMRKALLHTGAQGQKDLKLFKDKVTDYYFQNPERINSLRDIDPKVLNQMYSVEEQNAIRQYKALTDFERRDSFVKKAAEYNTAKERALTLYYKTPDDDFSYLMRAVPKETKAAMRAAVIEDALDQSRRAVAGVTEVPDPERLASNLSKIINDMGPRARLLFSEDQLKALMDKKTIAEFYASSARLADPGASIAAASTTSEAIGVGGQGVAGIPGAAIKVFVEKRLADLIANGPLNIFFRPKLGKPLQDQWLRSYVAATAASVNATMQSALPKEGENEFLEKKLQERKRGRGVPRTSQAQ